MKVNVENASPEKQEMIDSRICRGNRRAVAGLIDFCKSVPLTRVLKLETNVPFLFLSAYILFSDLCSNPVSLCSNKNTGKSDKTMGLFWGNPQ